MADIQHASISDPYLHEPKGASTASINTVYRADGSGSGDWIVLDEDSLDWAAISAAIQADLDDNTLDVTGELYVTAVIPDISTASSVIIPLPDSGTVVSARVVLGGPITVGDATISFTNAAAAGMGTAVTVPFTGSAKGNGYTFTATGNNSITGPSWIEVATNGGSTDAQPLYITVKYRKTLNT